MTRTVGVLAVLAIAACAGAPSSAVPSPAVTQRPTPPVTPPSTSIPTSTPGPTSPPTATLARPTPPGTPGGVPPAGIELHELALTPADLSGTAIGEGGGVIVVSGTTGTWISGWHEPGFRFTRLVPSWNAETPEGTWIAIDVQTRRAAGGETKWWSFGTWASADATVKRASVKGQRDADGDVETDVFLASAAMSAYRMRLTLSRVAGSPQTPVVRLVAAAVSAPAPVPTTPSPLGSGAGKELRVPPYSQEIHAGEYPEYDGGGEAWCSPASTAMVLAFWGKGPSAAEMAWVDPGYADKQVDHAARYTYDATYRGAGNWPFNTAYAARYGVRAFVTQLRSLTEAERFIAAGIPLVASVKVAPGALPGFLLQQGSPGHLLVIGGFTQTGDVIANDPAATGNATVRRVYPRGPFEQSWIGGSQGIVYVIHPASTPLPSRVQGATANW